MKTTQLLIVSCATALGAFGGSYLALRPTTVHAQRIIQDTSRPNIMQEAVERITISDSGLVS